MDFLKTLLLYMTVTMASAVQNGPLPEDVPTPTVAPTAQVEETAAPETTALPGLQVELPDVPTQTPAPTEVPNPTITPNRSYSNVQFGDRGNAVRKLQERLIELGYLPEDSADGAFGYQTNRAVRAFQSANGLNSDGVAGPATLTRLYEDPDVIAATTAASTGTPEPSATPEPETEPSAAAVLTIQPPEQGTETEAKDEDALETAPQAEEIASPTDEQADSAEQAQAEAAVPGLTAVEGAAIALGESGSPLAALRLIDGVMLPYYPRVWLNAEGAAVVSLRDMAECVAGWQLEIEDDTFTLNAAGYAVVLSVTEERVACAVDGEELQLAEGDVLADGEELYLSEAFLRSALNADVLWDADEQTLMLKIPEKEAAQASD